MKISGTKKIPKDKAATFGFKLFETDSKKEFIKYINTHAIVPVVLKKGHRKTENVKEILPFIRLDVDTKGMSKKVEKALKKCAYFKKPSVSNIRLDKKYKWHYIIPILNVSQNYDEYKLQYHKFLVEFGIDSEWVDMSLQSPVQNMNPAGEKGIKLTEYHKGKVWEAPKVSIPKRPKNKKKYSKLSKDEVKRILSRLTIHVPRDSSGNRIPGKPGMGYKEFLAIGMALYDWCPKRGYKLYKCDFFR